MGDPRNPALEAAIANDPFDREAYLVYADWLEGQGDPRAQLIALQCSPHPEQHAGKAVRKLLADHQKYFLEPLARFGKAVVWKYGFIHSVSFNDGIGRHVTDLANVIAHPSARFLVELGVSSRHLAEAIAVLAAAPPSLRTLSLSHEGPMLMSLAPLAPVLAQLVSLSLYGSFALDVLARVPLTRLRTLAIRHDRVEHLQNTLGPALGELTTLSLRGGLSLDAIELPALEVAELALDESSPAIAGARWPKLRRLVLGPPVDPHLLAPLFRRTDLRALTELAIRGATHGEALCTMLRDAPFARQLRRLELSRGTLDDAAARALAARPEAFDQLEELDVSDNPLSDDGYAALDGMGVVDLVDDRRYDETGE